MRNNSAWAAVRLVLARTATNPPSLSNRGVGVGDVVVQDPQQAVLFLVEHQVGWEVEGDAEGLDLLRGARGVEPCLQGCVADRLGGVFGTTRRRRVCRRRVSSEVFTGHRLDRCPCPPRLVRGGRRTVCRCPDPGRPQGPRTLLGPVLIDASGVHAVG